MARAVSPPLGLRARNDTQHREGNTMVRRRLLRGLLLVSELAALPVCAKPAEKPSENRLT
jgi:hypothetical protein